MVYYLGLFIILIITEMSLDLFQVKNRRKIFLTIAFLLMSFMAGFRDYSVGTDTMQFVNAYRDYANKGFEVVNFNQKYEPGFVLYFVLLSKISPNPRPMLILTYLFINFSVINFINKYAKDYFQSTIIYIFGCQFFASLTIMRQFISIAIILLSFGLLLNKKYFKFLIFVLIASMFHYFSVLCVLLVPMHWLKRMNAKLFIGGTIIFALLYFFIPQIVQFLITHIKNYNDYIPYLEEHGIVAEFRLPPMLLVLLALAAPAIINYRYVLRNSNAVKYKEYDLSFFGILYFFLFWVILFAGRYGLITRVYYYFMPFTMLMPNFFPKVKSWRIYIVLICLIIFVGYIMTGTSTQGTSNFIFNFN